MSRPRALLPLLVVLAALAAAAPASASVTKFELTAGTFAIPEPSSAAAHQALSFRATLDGTNQAVRIDLPAGFLGQVAGVPTCLDDPDDSDFAAGTCPDSTTVGTSSSTAVATIVPEIPLPPPLPPIPPVTQTVTATGDVVLLPPKPGQAALLGVRLTSMLASPILVRIPVTLRDDYGLRSEVPIPQTATVSGSPVPISVTSLTTTLNAATGGTPAVPFSTMPPTCGPLTGSAVASADGTTFEAASDANSATLTPQGCASVPFTPSVAFTTSSKAAGGSTGVTVALTQPAGTATQAQSPIASSVVTLPTGLGLDFAKILELTPCPSLDAAVAGSCEDARMGSVTVDTPAAGQLTGSAYFTAAAGTPPGTGIFVVAGDDNDAVRLRLTATTTPTAPVKTTLAGLPPTLATRFELAFDPLFTNPCTATAEGSAQLVAASGATASPTGSITTTGSCETTPPPTSTDTTPTTPTQTTPAQTTPTTPTDTTPTTTSTTPTTSTPTVPAGTPGAPSTPGTPAPGTTTSAGSTTPAGTTTPGGSTAPSSSSATRLRVSQQRLKGRRIRVRTLVLAGSARCDGTLRITINRGTRGKRLVRRTVKLPASCVQRTTFRLPRSAAGRSVSTQVALRGATQLRDATQRTKAAKVSRG